MNLCTMSKIKITCEYNHTWISHPLVIKFMIDDRIIHLDVSGNNQNKMEKVIEVDDGDHNFSMEISGKDFKNTIIDESNTVTSDTNIEVVNLEFDDVSINSMINHDTDFAKFFVANSNIVKTKSLIFGENGTLKFTFSSPIYSWLLEKLF